MRENRIFRKHAAVPPVNSLATEINNKNASLLAVSVNCDHHSLPSTPHAAATVTCQAHL